MKFRLRSKALSEGVSSFSASSVGFSSGFGFSFVVHGLRLFALDFLTH
jgi:hypothetical protein